MNTNQIIKQARQEAKNHIHRCLLLAISMPNDYPDDKAVKWIDETTEKIMTESVDQAITQAVEEERNSLSDRIDNMKYNIEMRCPSELERRYMKGYNQACNEILAKLNK